MLAKGPRHSAATMKPTSHSSSKPSHADFFGTGKKDNLKPITEEEMQEAQSSLSEKRADDFMNMAQIPTRQRGVTKKFDASNFDFDDSDD